MSARRDTGSIHEVGLERIPSGRWAIGLAILASGISFFVIAGGHVGHSVLAGSLIILAVPLLAIFDLRSLHKWYQRPWQREDVFWLLVMIFFALLVVPWWFVDGRWI